MSLRTHHVAGNLECISLKATSAASWGLPRPFPLTATWAVYIDSTAPDDYMTQFSFAPGPFTNHDYYQAAIRLGSATSSVDATWNCGFEGDHPTSAWTTITRSRWFYQGFRAQKFSNANNNVQIEYYFDLPDLTKKLDVSDLLGFTYDFVVGSSHSIHLGENNWPTTANNEAMEGEFQGFKIWQAFLDTRSLQIEAFNVWPVVPLWYGALWDVIPLITNLDKRRDSIKRINDRQWTFPNVAPGTGNRRAPLQSMKQPWLGYNNAGLTAATTDPVASLISRR